MNSGISKVREKLSSAEKVSLMVQSPGNLSPRAQELLVAATWTGDIEAILDRQYVVKGWLDRSAVSVIYGPSNVGKSFLALDLAHHVAKGLSWGGRRVRRGRVLYVAAEGGANFANRVAALDNPEFFVLTVAVTLTGGHSQAEPLSDVLQHLTRTGGAPFDLIVLDTMSRVMGGLDENTAPDIADLMRNLDLIRARTGAHVMLVHHSGKDVARGARGHSSLRAAIDSEIELTRDELGQITAEVTKQRDGPTGYRFVYTLRQVELGLDQDRDPVTTCVVEPMELAAPGHLVMSESVQKALDILDRVLAVRGETISKPTYPDAPCVIIDMWRADCTAANGISASEDKHNRHRTFRIARDKLVDAGIILVLDDLVWRIKP